MLSYCGNEIGLTVEDQVQSRILIMIMVTGTVISLEYENVLWVSWYSNMVYLCTVYYVIQLRYLCKFVNEKKCTHCPWSSNGGRFKVADAKSEIFLPALEERNSRVVICFCFRG